MVCPPIPPKLFFCKKCKVYFYSWSQLETPTHSKCTTHSTQLADNFEVKLMEKTDEIITELYK